MNSYRKLIKTSIIIVSVSILSIFLIQSFLCGFGVHMNYSISRYVGLSPWSAILFLLCNIANFVLIFKALRLLDEKYNFGLLWRIISFIMILALLVLSAFPVGLHDEIWGNFGPVSIVHRTSAGVMFVSAILVMLLSLPKLKQKLHLIIAFVAFAFYGVFFVVGFKFGLSLVTDNMFIPEALFLLLFLLNLYIIDLPARKKPQIEE